MTDFGAETVIFPTLAAIFILHGGAHLTQPLFAKEGQPSMRSAVNA
jgi:hypothetical protein